MRKIWKLVLSLMIAIGFMACSDGSNENATSTADVIEQSIIDIPSCVTTTSDSAARKKEAATKGETESVYDVYEGIIENIEAVEKWKQHVIEVVRAVEILNGFTSEGRYEDSITGETIVWGPSDQNGYSRMIELYWNDVLGFQAFLTVNNTSAKGHLIWDFSVAVDEENPDNNAQVEIIFDGTSDPKWLEIKATNMKPENGQRYGLYLLPDFNSICMRRIYFEDFV